VIALPNLIQPELGLKARRQFGSHAARIAKIGLAHVGLNQASRIT
jgi:hypothetical protein